jgi:hypothetical protein
MFSPGVMRRQVLLLKLSYWPCAVVSFAVPASRTCTAEEVSFDSQCKKEQHKCRETTESQRNFVIVALGLEFRCSVTGKALAGGHEFSPVVLVLLCYR